MNYLAALILVALSLLACVFIIHGAFRAFLWLKAEWVPITEPLTDVETAARYWEAISTYHDLPDGSSVFLAIVAPDGQLSIIKDHEEIKKTAIQILQNRDERRNRWAILKHWRSACRPSTDS